MPVQLPTPLAGLGSVLDSHDERLRGAEVNRIGYSGGTANSTSPPLTAIYIAPTGWPSQVVTLGITGNCLVFASATLSLVPGSFFDVGVVFDGGNPNSQSVELGTCNFPAGSTIAAGVGGFSFAPNSVHTFTMTTRSASGGTASSPFFVVLPI